eukprot:2133767-Rhodomonas_salina.1
MNLDSTTPGMLHHIRTHDSDTATVQGKKQISGRGIRADEAFGQSQVGISKSLVRVFSNSVPGGVGKKPRKGDEVG